MEPEKPFACSMADCGMTFTNEDHLHVHTKKHAMVLQLGMEQKAAFVADQTPTPTRFIRNCEEVGLFQDLQNVTVNPFDEGFKRAMETKHGMLTLEGPSSTEDALHTPHLFPLETADCTLYTANNQRNITISRSSSDESGVVKEYETTKISTLTNEVTKISRIVGKDLLDRVTTDDVTSNKVRHEETTTNKNSLETSVSFTNNVIIQSNVEIRQDINIDTKKVSNNTTNTDSVVKDTLSIDELVKIADSSKAKEKLPPIMSQKSLDLVVDSLNSDSINNDSITKNLKRNYSEINKIHENDKSKPVDKTNKVVNDDSKDENDCNYEVIIKLPCGKNVRLKAKADEVEKPTSVKQTLNTRLKSKLQEPKQDGFINNPIQQNIVPISTGTLIPVTLVNPNQMTIIQNGIPKIPIKPLAGVKKTTVNVTNRNKANNNNNKCKNVKTNVNERDGVRLEKNDDSNSKHTRSDLDSRSAASRRYRKRLKLTMENQKEEIVFLREKNQRLTEEKSILQLVIAQHLKDCPNAQELRRSLQQKLRNINDSTIIIGDDD